MAEVLLFAPVPVFTAEGMASGIGLRVWGLARALAGRGHRVRIAEPASVRPTRSPAPQDPRIEMIGWDRPRASRAMIEAADVVVVQPTMGMWPHFVRCRPRCLVVDVYAPMLLEAITFLQPQGQNLHDYSHLVACLLFFLRRGDVF